MALDSQPLFILFVKRLLTDCKAEVNRRFKFGKYVQCGNLCINNDSIALLWSFP